jgi:uncharacterized protein YcbX
MILSDASMKLLNSKLKEKLEIERFRPNIIVTGCSAHDEVRNAVAVVVRREGSEGLFGDSG